MKGRGGAAVSDVFRYEEVPPSHQPSGGGHEAGSPLGRRPWSARRGHGLPRASATWLAPGCRPHRGAAPQLRFVVGRYAATAARYAAQVWRTRPKPFYETQPARAGTKACSLPSSSASGRAGRAHGSGNCWGVHRSAWHFPTLGAHGRRYRRFCAPSWQMVPLTVGGRQRDGRGHGAYSKLSQPRRRARSGQSAVEAEPQPCPFRGDPHWLRRRACIGRFGIVAHHSARSHRRSASRYGSQGRRIWCVQRRTSADPSHRAC